MNIPWLLQFLISLGAVSLSVAQENNAAVPSALLNAHEGQHVVYLRTGTVDVNAEHQRLPRPTPAARRLLQQPSPAPSMSPEWGPLAATQLWLLTLGPQLHVQQPQRGQQHLLVRPGRPSGTGPTSLTGGPDLDPNGDVSRPQFRERQATLLGRLNQAGCAVVSFLPPAAWLVVVADQADLADLIDDYPDIRLAPYGPPSLRVSPELAAVLTVLRQAGEAVAERLVAGDRLDDLLAAAAADQTGWLLGALRVHQPSRAAPAGLADVPQGEDSVQPSRLVVEVHFPQLQPGDVVRLVEQEQARAGGAAAAMDAAASDPAVPYHPAAAATVDWSAALAAVSPPDCPPLLEPDHGSPDLLLVAVCPAALEATVQWLAAAPQVSWLAPRMNSRLHNLAAGAITQTGGNLTAVRSATTKAAHPFWVAGLDGRNQTVGCGDSGMDVNHCFFVDNSVGFKGNTRVDSDNKEYFASDTHRKIRYYLAAVHDMVDDVGHGTHVVGTMIGSSNERTDLTAEPLDLGTGQAPAAKIAFMDLASGSGDGVRAPGDLGRSYFDLTYAREARVHSDSWGSELTAYDSRSASLDRFTWYNQDFVSVFAAGNYGGKSSASTTITSPAVAKNCIAVGATLSMPDGISAPTSAGWVKMYNMTVVQNMAGGQVTKRGVRVVAGGVGLGGDFSSPTLDNTLLALATPNDACTGLSNAGGVRDKVVLVQRGHCYFNDKVRNAAAAGAKAIIVYNDRQEGGYISVQSSDGASPGYVAVPLGVVPLSTGRWLMAALDAGTVSVTFRAVSQPRDYAVYDDIAVYSSFGPTADGRIKPDIVAPGYLMSAATGTSCSLRPMMGTSMATPLVAGSALLVRQYFTDGYYPEGKPNPGAGFPPSGPLIKAVLLGGAVHMQGVVQDTGMPLEDVPSYRQGFGRISLLHSLPLPGSSPGWRLQVVDGAELATTEQHHFCIRATGGPLRITLAWYDWPGNPAASRALVNNLDLQVRAVGRGGLLDLGNGVQDSVNTVEQVWYDDLDPGDVAISVSAGEIFKLADKQPYALVVQGKFSGTLHAPSTANPSDNTCAAQLAMVDDLLSTSSLTNLKNVTFYFSTQDGNSPQSGFECSLSPEGQNSTDWQPCRSPKRYTNQPDGRYSFQVRVRNEQVAAVRSVTIDTQPPVTTLTSELQAQSGGSDGGIVTAVDRAAFTFTADDDATSINFICKISFSNGTASDAVPPYLRLLALDVVAAAIYSNATALGPLQAPVARWFNCSSPLELIGMSYGDYSLEVMAYDEAQNSERSPKSIAWSIRYKPNIVYARMASGPSGLIANKTLDYSVVGFRGAADTPPQDLPPGEGQQYESAVLNASDTGAAAAAAWQPVDSQLLPVSVPVDGSYLVVVRPASSSDNTTWAIASVQVDTTPPVVKISRGPAAVQVDPRVTIWFGDSGPEGEIRAYYCRWLGPAPEELRPEAVDPAAPAYSSCAAKSTVNVTEGWWLFQVKGRDAVGNLGAPTNVSFRTDLFAPVIVAGIPPAVNTSRVLWSYSVDDGVNGTGVASVNCTFKWTQLVSIGNVVVGDKEYPAGDASANWAACPASPAKYTVQEGLYLWSVDAVDRANLQTNIDYQLVVDFTPPLSRVLSGRLRQGRSLPSRFTVDIVSVDRPERINSGVAQQQCKIDGAAAPPPVAPPPPPMLPPGPPPPGPPNSTRSASTGGTGGGGGRRMAQQQASGMRIMNGSAVQLGEWHVCDATGDALNVTYDGFSTGYYVISVRALDLAGNLGEGTPPAFFSVDASLPLDGPETVGGGDSGGGGGSSKTKKIVIGVAVLVGILVIIGSVVAIIYARRRHLRKRYGAPPPLSGGRDAANGISMQPMNQYEHGNGHGSVIGGGGQMQAGVPSVIMVPIASGHVGMGAAPGMPYYPVMGGVVAGVPAAGTDPALAAALAASAGEAERMRAAAAASEEQERVRRAIAASLEEENLRRAMTASLSAARQEHAARADADADQAAMDAAIAASLATAENEQRRQHSQARAQLQHQQPPSAPAVRRPPDDSLI